MAGPLGLAPKRGQVQLDKSRQRLPKLGFMGSNPTPALYLPPLSFFGYLRGKVREITAESYVARAV
jgi:hypothetical protein